MQSVYSRPINWNKDIWIAISDILHGAPYFTAAELSPPSLIMITVCVVVLLQELVRRVGCVPTTRQPQLCASDSQPQRTFPRPTDQRLHKSRRGVLERREAKVQENVRHGEVDDTGVSRRTHVARASWLHRPHGPAIPSAAHRCPLSSGLRWPGHLGVLGSDGKIKIIIWFLSWLNHT